MSGSDDRRIRVLETMIRARVFETRLGEVFSKQREHAKSAYGGRNAAFEEFNAEFRIPIQGNIELSLGQEAGPAALCSWLTREDYAAGTHRSHSLAIAKGVSWRNLLAEIYGRSGGLCGGRGGDFMLNDPSVNFENSAIMGQLTAVAAGHAFAQKRRSTSNISAVFIGEGAANQGVVHESMNLASLWRLPLVFVIEDNGYAISTPRRRASAVDDLSVRAAAYGMPGTAVNDYDVPMLIECFGAAVDRARSGAGPSLVVCKTRRLSGAFEGDNQSYRPAEELVAERARDALGRFTAELLEQGVTNNESIDAVMAGAYDEFSNALAFAESSPYPDPSSAWDGVFA